MSFFELIPEDRMGPEARESIEAAKKRKGGQQLDRVAYALARHPRVLKTFFQAREGFLPIPSRFGANQYVAGMLIAHAKHCRACFQASRGALASLGFTDALLNEMCELPATLPLPERERRFVEFTLRVARDPQGLKPSDFREMEQAGFSKDEILEMIGVAAYWNLATTLASAVDAGLQEE